MKAYEFILNHEFLWESIGFILNHRFFNRIHHYIYIIKIKLFYYSLARYILGCPPINPCLYNGTCVEKPFGFTCICPKAYFGNRCQRKRKRKTTAKITSSATTLATSLSNVFSNKTTQSSLSLSNHTEGFNLLISTSKTETNEKNLIIPKNSCNDKFICKNKGVCLETFNGFKCQCLPEFTGIYCEYFYEFSFIPRIINKSINQISDEKSTNK